jgi:hypothetical protein
VKTPRYKQPPQPFPANQGSGNVNAPYFIQPVVADPQVIVPMKNPQFRLLGQEINVFDGYARELNGIIGPDVDYYLLNTTVNVHANVTNYPYPQPNPHEYPKPLPTTVVDPLYNEAVAWAFQGPYRLPMYIAYPQKDVISGEEGERTHWDATAWVSREEYEAAQLSRPPSEGDIIQIWKTPFYKDYSTNDIIPIPNSGYYFDIKNVEEDGHLNDSPDFVGYKLTLIRRTEFTPERKIKPP